MPESENEISTQALLLEIHNSLRELIAVNKGLNEIGEPIVGASAMQAQVQMSEDRSQKGTPSRIKQTGQKKVSMQEGEQAQTKFRPSPFQPPCPVPPPAGAPPGVEPDHTELIQHILEQHETFREILVQLTEISKSPGIAPRLENEYYNTPQTVIQVATPNPPAGIILDPAMISNPVTGTPGYQVEGIFTQLQRKSPRVTVINDGTSILYAITTSDSSTWSQEAPILIGEARTFFNVWELRLRSPTAGNLTLGTGGIYRVTEYDFWLAYSSAIAAAALNRAAFTAPSVQPIANLPATTQLPAIAVPNGFDLVVRATVGNATVIYLADSAANLAIPANRITLNAGDTASLTITNANLVFVAGLGPGANNVDILVEQ